MNHIKKILTVTFLCITTMFSVVFADFNGASMPLEFIPNWEKKDFIIQRHTLLFSPLTTDDLMFLPSPKDIHTSFLSNFTYMTLFTGAYMDPDRGENV